MTTLAPVEIEKIVLGCGSFGGVGSLSSLIGKGDSPQQAFRLLDEARAYGIFQLDTANSYGAGQSEEILGRWLRGLPMSERLRLRIASKVGNPHGTRPGQTPLAREEISFQLDRSLKRLGLESLSIYFLHEPDPATSIEETLEALARADAQGKIGAIGLSNVTIDYVTRILNTCDQNLRGKIRYVQNEFHFLHQDDSRELIPFLARRSIDYWAFSPLAGGLLSGKYLDLAAAPAGSRLALRPEPYQRYLARDGLHQIKAFVTEAKARGCEPAAAALNFVVHSPGVSAAIIGPRRKEDYVSLGLRKA